MTTLVVGDVHGCARELADLLSAAGPADAVLVGDLYTKGPDPEGVWEQIRDRGLRAVLGNHDQRLLRVLDGARPKDRHGAEVVARLDRTGPAWRDHLRSLPLHLEVGEWTIVHAGIHPSGDLERTNREQLLYLRRWPDAQGRNDPSEPFWWQVYAGRRRVVYGHDALRKLVRTYRDGQLQTCGLDTGCVYGDRLSGLRLDRQDVVSVPAHGAWYAPEV